MSRPIASVYVGIARLAWEVGQVPDGELGGWTARLAKCLATGDKSIHDYGAFLLTEAETYRHEESEKRLLRAKNKGTSAGIRRNPLQSAESALTDRQTDRQELINNKQNNTPLPHKGGGMRGSRKFKEQEHHPDVVKVYDYYKEVIKPSTRKGAALMWISRRMEAQGDHGAERLVMSVAKYMMYCRDKMVKEEFKKDCANFFGEDAAYENYLPGEGFFITNISNAHKVLGREVEPVNG